jgi:hypothetical protein
LILPFLIDGKHIFVQFYYSKIYFFIQIEIFINKTLSIHYAVSINFGIAFFYAFKSDNNFKK